MSENQYTSKHGAMKIKGRGVLNRVPNNLPVELHIPGYQYCGPGTKLEKRLARADPGINPLDRACKVHDIAYSTNREDVAARNRADRELALKAWERARSSDAGLGEKAAAFVVAKIMKSKAKRGMGVDKVIKKKRKNCKQGGQISFRSIVNAAKTAISPTVDIRKAITSSVKAARKAVKN